jgi:hypothetical protein
VVRLWAISVKYLNSILIPRLPKKTGTMLKKRSEIDLIMRSAAEQCQIFPEVMWFQGEKQGALFIGLWVPSSLGCAVYLKLLKIEGK